MAKKLLIAKIPDSVLRQVAKDISIDAIKSRRIQDLIEDMKLTLKETPNGVGLAAPQVGQSLRLFIVSEEAEEIDRIEKDGEKRVKHGKIRDEEGNEKEAYEKRDWKYYAFINPKALKQSKIKLERAEGCLSVPKKFGEVKRFEKITVSAYGEHGKKFTRGATRFFARVIQHELDHLEGALFIDKAKHIFEEDDKK